MRSSRHYSGCATAMLSSCWRWMSCGDAPPSKGKRGMGRRAAVTASGLWGRQTRAQATRADRTLTGHILAACAMVPPCSCVANQICLHTATKRPLASSKEPSPSAALADTSLSWMPLVAPPNPLASPTSASLSGCCLSSLTPSVIVSVLMRLPKSPRDGRQFFRVLLFLMVERKTWEGGDDGAIQQCALSPPGKT